MRDLCSVFLSDIVSYTVLCSTLAADKVAVPLSESLYLVECFTDQRKYVSPKVSNLLDRLYTKFDELSVTHGVTKIDTIGDA